MSFDYVSCGKTRKERRHNPGGSWEHAHEPAATPAHLPSARANLLKTSALVASEQMASAGGKPPVQIAIGGYLYHFLSYLKDQDETP